MTMTDTELKLKCSLIHSDVKQGDSLNLLNFYTHLVPDCFQHIFSCGSFKPHTHTHTHISLHFLNVALYLTDCDISALFIQLINR